MTARRWLQVLQSITSGTKCLLQNRYQGQSCGDCRLCRNKHSSGALLDHLPAVHAKTLWTEMTRGHRRLYIRQPAATGQKPSASTTRLCNPHTAACSACASERPITPSLRECHASCSPCHLAAKQSVLAGSAYFLRSWQHRNQTAATIRITPTMTPMACSTAASSP